MAVGILCRGCGVHFSAKSKQAKYCCMSCRRISFKAKARACVSCGGVFTPIKWHAEAGKFISYNAGKTCSALCQNQWIRNNPERKRKISVAFRGSLHPNWQGGKSLLNNVSARGPNWQAQRLATRRRDKFTCVDCGMSEGDCLSKFGRSLDVDHVVPFHNFNDYRVANKLGNLKSRCASCHRRDEAKRSMVQMVLPLQESKTRGHKGYARGEKINTAYLTASDVMEIRSLYRAGLSYKYIAEKKSTTKTNVCSIVRGKTWRHLPF